MGFPINPNNTLDYDSPAPSPDRIWHVDGLLASFDKSTTLDGSRVLHAANETEAAEKVLIACRSVRGNEWGWVGQVRVYPHYAWDDPDCPVCKRRNHKEYPKAIDALYEPVVLTPTRLTDGAGEYVAPSAAAMEYAKDYFTDIRMSYESGGHSAAAKTFAYFLQSYAAQQVAAAVKERNAEIVATLEHQAEVWERMKDVTPSAELRANVYRSAANIIEQ